MLCQLSYRVGLHARNLTPHGPAAALTRRYQLALTAYGLHATALGDEATWRGLAALADTLDTA